MQIICPHCTTSFAINPRALGTDGRTVRCARCKETWFALPADAVAEPALAVAGDARLPEPPARPAAEAPSGAFAGPPSGEIDAVPVMDSPSISDGLAAEERTGISRLDADIIEAAPSNSQGRRTRRSAPPKSAGALINAALLPAATIVMAAMAIALVVWRADVVRLLPQTAIFFKTLGLEVNPQGLTLRNVKASAGRFEDQAALLVEGEIESIARTTIRLPQLHFIVRDKSGAEISSWDATPEKTSLSPRGTLQFNSHIAPPPENAYRLDVRFRSARKASGA